MTGTASWVGAGKGLDVDCVGSAEVGSKEPNVRSNSVGTGSRLEIAHRNGGGGVKLGS